MNENSDFIRQNQNMYNAWAKAYDNYTNSTVFCDELHFPKHWALLPPSKILEIGCGTGRHTKKLVDFGHELTAIDISEGMLEIAKSKIKSAQFIHGNFLEYNFNGQKFDFIIMALVLEHLPDKEIVFAKIAELLTSGGKFFLSEIHHSRMENGSGARFTDENGSEIRAASFTHNNDDVINSATNHGFELVANEVVYGTKTLVEHNKGWEKYSGKPMIEIFEFLKP